MENVVPLVSRKRSQNGTAAALPLQEEAEEHAVNASSGMKYDFETVLMRNNANKDRIKKERDQANKNVLKSYRIK